MARRWVRLVDTVHGIITFVAPAYLPVLFLNNVTMASYTDSDLAAAHAYAKTWAKDAVAALRVSGRSMGIQGTSLDAMKGGVALWADTGLIRYIGFGMQRSLIFTAMGVGKDTPKAMRGKTNRRAKEFITPVLDARLQALADGMAVVYGDAIAKKIQFLR